MESGFKWMLRTRKQHDKLFSTCPWWLSMHFFLPFSEKSAWHVHYLYACGVKNSHLNFSGLLSSLSDLIRFGMQSLWCVPILCTNKNSPNKIESTKRRGLCVSWSVLPSSQVCVWHSFTVWNWLWEMLFLTPSLSSWILVLFSAHVS